MTRIRRPPVLRLLVAASTYLALRGRAFRRGNLSLASVLAENSRLLDASIANAGRAPKHSITDQGAQFKSKRFKKWLKRHGIKHRFGAVGKHGSIAFLERCWRTLKEWVPWTWCVFGTAASLERHVADVRRWYNVSVRPTASGFGDQFAG